MILILTPLAVEKRALEAALSGCTGVALRLGGHGKVAMALSAQAAILELQPSFVICCGAAGSLSSAVAAGDVVVGSSTIEHDFKLRFVSRPLPEFPGSVAAIELVRGLPGVHVGRIASGDEDIVSAPRAAEVAADTSALAVAWEGAGAARACALHDVPFLEIRGISDLADENAIRDFRESLTAVMGAVAEVVKVLCSEAKRVNLCH